MKKLVLLFLLLPTALSAAPVTCRKSPALAGQCRVVRGSLGYATDTGVTVTPDSGSPIAIKSPPDSDADIAPPVMQNWLYFQSKTGKVNTRIRGDFMVCPLPPDGAQEQGCIASGTHFVLDPSQN